MDNDECDMCWEYQRCTSEKCTDHILYEGVVKDLAMAMKEGRFWGDIIYEEDQKKLANETKEQKTQRLKKKALEEREAVEKLKEIILNKNRIRNCVKVGSKYVLKHKYVKMCENLKLPEETFSDGSKYPGGCWAHDEKLCPFIHPDEKSAYDFKGKTKILLVEEKKNSTFKRSNAKTKKRNNTR